MIYKCPVCNGRGFVPAGFYSWYRNDQCTWSVANTFPEVCRSCNGTGVVFEHINPPVVHIDHIYGGNTNYEG